MSRRDSNTARARARRTVKTTIKTTSDDPIWTGLLRRVRVKDAGQVGRIVVRFVITRKGVRDDA